MFYSLVDNLIQGVPLVTLPGVVQNQNVGSARFWGAEISADYWAREDFSIGGNLTLLRRQLSPPPLLLNVQPIGVPDAKLIVYAGYRPLRGLTLTPNIELASNRWTSTSNGQYYYRTGSYFLTNFNVDYQINENVMLTAGVRNLLDQQYSLVDGYPSAGRNFYLASKVTF